MRCVLRVLLFCLLSTWCCGSSIIYLRVHRGVLEERLKSPPDNDSQRFRKLRAQFEAAGCKDDRLYQQPISKEGLPNLMCTLPGSESGSIVVGAPIDFAASAVESDTQWATLALLPLLAESIGSVQHRYSLIFVAFAGHKHGLRGSSEYLRQLSGAQRSEIRAMVSLEDLGRTPLVYAIAQQDPMLANWLFLAAHALRLQSMPMEITARTVDAPLVNGAPAFNPDEYLSDATVFRHSHIPSITFRSAPRSMIPEMRRAGVWAGNSTAPFDVGIYEQIYNQLSVYLLFLDSNLGRPRISSPVQTVLASAPATGGDASKAEPAGSATIARKTTVAPADGLNSPNPILERQPAMPADIPLFHTQARLVVMDVSITDVHGAPVRGLKAEDFTVFENGEPQKVRVFEAHVPQSVSSVPPGEALPQNTFSNRISAVDDAPLGIFLLDLLNTPVGDQAFAREQMLKFLKAMPRGRHLALFILGTRLQMVQGFTDNPETLVTAAEKVAREISPLLTTQAQLQQDQGFVEQTGREARPEVPSNIPENLKTAIASAQTDAKPVFGFVGSRTDTAALMEGIRSDERTTSTLEALKVIARSVSAYPGRKNLVWLSGSFQIRLRPSDNSFLNIASRTTQTVTPISDLSNTARFENSIRIATTALATARVAVYPIDVRGLRTGGVDIAVGADQTRAMVDSANNDSYGHTLTNQSDSRSDEQSSMIDLADQTGGHVFINNDVRGSIARSLEEGSSYYTLAYAPEKNGNENNKSFRRVEIRLNRESVKLAYRPGYYPMSSQEESKQSGAHMLAAAMQPGLPQSTMLLVTAKILPPDATSKSLRIDYSIDFKGLDFVEMPDKRKRTLLDCMAIALDSHGQVAGQIANTMDADLPPKEFEAYQTTGLPLHQELVLPPGTYDIRLGVLDRASQKIGTIDIPLVIAF